MLAFYVALGGASGALARWLAQIIATRYLGTTHVGTFTVNVVGCLTIGLLSPFLTRLPIVIPPLVVVGFLGGLTTMSGYSLECWNYAVEGKWSAAAVYGATGVLGSLLACGAGIWLGQKIA